MYFEEIHTVDEAKAERLIPLTVWLYKYHLDWLISERDRIGSNPIRKAMIVQMNSSYALFVNDMTGKYITYDENFDTDIAE